MFSDSLYIFFLSQFTRKFIQLTVIDLKSNWLDASSSINSNDGGCKFFFFIDVV